ncbi:MAG TPA: outer membrane protein assembly factor BamA [Candidatus Binataceae bacterium]|nr:outer membrane protein assembly factor BamA [Candidatus Binataceae bacterium]
MDSRKRCRVGERLIHTMFLIAALTLVASRAGAQPPPTISRIRIVGNQRVEEDAIRIHISEQPGQALNDAMVDRDVKSIYRMGFFTDVHASVERTGDQAILTFHVRERPLITDVRTSGMSNIKPTADEVVGAIKLHSGVIEDPQLVESSIQALRQVYQSKGYLDADVTFHTIAGPSNTAVGVFQVKEGPLVEISAIDFVGNKHFSSRRLSGLMETRKHTLLSRFFNTGVLDRTKLQDDVDRLTAFYYNHGYLQVHIGDPAIVRHGNSIVVTVNIDEGPVFDVGKIGVAGDLKFPRSELMSKLTLKPKRVFNGADMEHDVLTLSDFYSDRGYAFVNVDPRTQVDPAAHRVDVTYQITPGNEVLIDRIKISGNTKTSDKVIRREIRVQEQEPYSASKIQESKQRLNALGFFQSVRLSTEPARQPDKINLDVNVQEGNTASFQVGGGYDSASSLFGTFLLQNTNLFGGGESAAFSAEIGFLFENLSVTYTEPWFLDMPLAVSLQGFDNKLYLFSFNQSEVGFLLNSGYPLAELGLRKLGPFSLEHITAGLGYEFESVGISGLSPFTTFDIQAAKGYTRVSEFLPSLRRFTVDDPRDPRSGSIQTLDLELAGAGGTPFIKGVAHGHWFFPFIKSPTLGEWVYSPAVTLGWGTSLESGTGGNLPLYERFFPGGLNGQGQVRGYEIYSLGPQVTLFNQLGQPFGVEQVGGSKELLFSQQIGFPIIEALGMRGNVFFDAGNSFLTRDSITFDGLQYAWGIGLFWKSPFGPINVDIARPINRRPNDQSTVFDFGAGAPL